MNRNPEKLTCRALLLCDRVYTEEGTKKHIIVGTFNKITTRGIPFEWPVLTVFCTLTNGHGDYDFKICFVHEATDVEVASVRGPLFVPSPLDTVEFTFAIQGLPFPAAGRYWVQAQADGEIIACLPLDIVLAYDSSKS